MWSARLGVRGEAWSCALCWDMMSRVSPEPGVYVARYGWNGRSGGLIIGAAVFVLIAVTAPMSLALRVVTLVLFGGGALVFIASIATRRVALRVDASGITLGGSPGRYRSATRLIPWADGAARARRLLCGPGGAAGAGPASRQCPMRSHARGGQGQRSQP
jgi:hypothetical protein